MELRGRVGPGLGRRGDSECGFIAIILNCENIPPPKKSCYSGGGALLQSAVERGKHRESTGGDMIEHITVNYSYFLGQQLQ